MTPMLHARKRPVPYLVVGLLSLGLLAGCQPTGGEGGSQMREVTQYSIEDFLGNVNYSGASFSPDNTKLLVSSDQSGIYNAYAFPAGGGEPVQLTTSTDDYVIAMGYFPDDERFLYTSDQGGNELNHVYVQDTEGNATDLTPGEDLKANFYGWAQDDQSFFVGPHERDQRFFDVYEYQTDGYERAMIFQNDEAYTFSDISPDRRFIALGKTKTNADSDVYLYDRETEELKHLTPHEGDIINSPQSFSPDGASFYYLTDQDSEYQYLVRYDLGTEERETVVQTEWDVWYGYFSKNGKYMVVGINNDARTELRIYDAATMELVDLPDLGEADITSVGFSGDESHMAFYASSSRMPRDLFVYDFSAADPTQLTHSLNESIDPYDLVDGQVARFASYDGVEVPGILYKPHQAGPGNEAPALVWVHGGPGGQSRIGYYYLTQYLVNHGYAIFAINNRGSSGYGKTFFHLDDRKHGEADLDDCVESKKLLADTGWIDTERIGIIGGSYGGYMTLAALTFRPEAFDLGVDLFGISNWHRTVTNIPPWWESFREALQKEMGDFEDEAFFRAKSSKSRIGYYYLTQYLVNHGYAIFAINNRGSSGYGKTFFHLDDRKHGEADLDDCVESKKLLADTGWIDTERIGIIGGSYGGYMTLAALTFRPEAFDLGVDLFGISNWHRTVTNIPPWWESFREALQKEMGDFEDEAFFRAKSPLFHASNIVRPLMVLQGANDPRVLKVESDEIVEAVKANGVPVDYVLFDDEGHGFIKKENQEEAARRILAFLDEHLKKAETDADALPQPATSDASE